MAIKELTEEQTKTWTRAQKDRWWFENVFRGNLPQLTWRSGLTGFILGGFLAATNLYIGAKNGMTLGVGLTSVILAFAMFKLLSKLGAARDFTILENNAMQSIATSAGYMTSPFISSLAALMLITGEIIPWWQMILWNIVICILGVLVAFPLKRRFINDEQQPFPEGRACGVVLDTLYSDKASSGMFKAKLLGLTAGVSGTIQFLTGDGWMKLIQFKLLGLDEKLGMLKPWHIYERFDEYYYALAVKWDLWIPKILGTDIREMGLRGGIDAAMVGVGGLMGIRTATSVLIGTLLNFAVLAPIMIHMGDIKHPVDPETQAILPLSMKEIINQWSLWWAVTMMVVGSLVGLFSKPKMFIGAFTGLFKKKTESEEVDVLKHIELPLWISYVGIPIFAGLGAWMAHTFFGASWVVVLASFPLIFILSMIAANSMALTSWTPTGALSKITQFTMGAIDHSNPATNLSAAGMTGEVASNTANLLSDIKPGYMLGAKPRQQAIGHVIGIFSGAIASTPLFYLLFLPAQPDGTRSVKTLISEQFAMPAAQQWRGVAEIIGGGLKQLPTSAITAMVCAAIAALIFEVLRIVTKGKFPLSAVAIGLGAVLPPDACLCMFAGAFFFYIMGLRHKQQGTRGNLIWVECVEPICAGLITGAALIGIGNVILNAVL
ncbi:MAG: OPT/YSL family transporter [Puniceicoccales bacterium]|jgi:uncharacterized oligopeptide transporter (OPT) family protein|nr:OPT/YSL family transporter [Puniceicoccales bacterium]